jgi:hypothetical protein
MVITDRVRPMGTEPGLQAIWHFNFLKKPSAEHIAAPKGSKIRILNSDRSIQSLG